MWEIWANYLFLKALKSCPNSNKSPNLVTLVMTQHSIGKTIPRMTFSEVYLTIIKISLFEVGYDDKL